MEKFKSWYNTLTDATKYMFLLVMIFTITNIALIVVSKNCSDKIIGISSNTVFSEKSEVIYEAYGLKALFTELKSSFERVVLVIVNIIAYYFSYWIGKIFGYFKSLAEMFNDIKSDGWIGFAFFIYNCVSVLFDTMTIMSFINIIK